MASNRAGLLSGGAGFLSRVVAQLSTFAVMLVAARLLSVEAFGHFALASLFLFLAKALFYVGPYEYLLKSPATPPPSAECYSANLVLVVVLSALLGLASLVAPSFFQTASVSKLILALVPSLFFVATVAWYEAILLRKLAVRRYYAANLAGDLVGGGVAVALLIAEFGVLALVAQTYARLAVLLLAYFRVHPNLPRAVYKPDAIREILEWSRARYGAVTLNFVTAYGADFVVGAILSPAAAGLYRASHRIVAALTDLFAQPLQKIAQANLSARVARGGALDTSWLSMLAAGGAIGWAALVGLAMTADDLVPLILGEKWSAAAPIVVALCAIKAFTLLDAVTTSFLVSTNSQGEMFKVQLTAALMVVPLALLAAPFGPVAVAWAAGIASMTMSLRYGWMVAKKSRADRATFGRFWSTAIPPALCVALALLAGNLFASATALQSIVIAGLFGSIGLGVGLLISGRRLLDAIGSLSHQAVTEPAE